jgi:hypothetical protein
LKKKALAQAVSAFFSFRPIPENNDPKIRRISGIG